jgi:hypothetical protein
LGALPIRNGQARKLNANLSKIEHQRVLRNDSGNADLLFHIRKANLQLNNMDEAKLLVNKVLLAWKFLLRNKLDVSTYNTTAFIWIGVKAQLSPILYHRFGKTFVMYHFQDTLLDRSFDPESIKAMWETAITSYNEMYPDREQIDNSA